MKKNPYLTTIMRLATVLAVCASATVTLASPYASGVTNNSGTIQFTLNEGGGTVDVVFEDNTTNSMGVLAKGPQSFSLGSHTSYSIHVTKLGTGTPALISTDTDQFCVWNSPRGVAVNQDPKAGYLFGRTYVGNSAAGGTAPNDKGLGLYALNADQTEALGKGKTATATSTFSGSGGSGPWRMRIAPDNTVLVDDFSTAAAALWQFKPDLSDSNLVLSIIGQTAAVAAGIHGDFFGTPLMTGSLAAGNLVLWTADSGMAAPGSATLGPGTSVGSYNNIFRYDIGSGPLPWNHSPNYAYTLGLDGIPELRTEMTLGNDGKIIAGYGRANLSNPNIQILDPTGTTLLYTSGNASPANTPPPSDPWNGINGSGAQVGTYCGVRVSPDGRFLASVDINNGITIANLTNGIPDDSSIFGIQNAPNVGNSRGMCWDAANNIYVVSSGQGLLRVYSLGITSTCVTSNDFSGTNGNFRLILPETTASIAVTTQLASQNYINNLTPGTPIPGLLTISLSKSTLAAPVTVNFTRGGTASLTNNYNFNYGTNADGVVISANSVIFPAGTWPHAGNWSVALQVIPTATPVSTNTLTAVITVAGGANYLASAPVRGTVFIQNTGPQLLLLTAAASGTTMYRGVTNDYSKFVITRLGDTNGPGNSAGNVNPAQYTVTNVTYFGTAVYPTDYKARAQRIDPAGDGKIIPPVDGPTAIVIKPGDTTVTCVVGNPVPHANLRIPPADATIVVNLTNAVACPACTNLTSQEGLSYSVGTATTTLTEIDNAVGPEIVLWSNPLTNAADSVNWTLTFGAVNFGTDPMLPAVFRNYANASPSGPTNDFNVTFGNPVASDSVPPSPVMAANGWTGALKMTVNKSSFSQAGVNIYPQGQNFFGNYALRFNMYLALYQLGINNPNIGSAAREFALFGINHRGTNCNWRTAAPIAAGAGNYPTNSDGQWFAIDAGAGSITPADFDALVPPPVPNNANAGALNDKVSNTSASQNGVFKRPPFDAMNVTVANASVSNPGGGEPVNKWVDVSVEVTRQTNINVFINRSQVLTSFPLTNGSLSTTYTNGTIMLGYDDPNADVSDNSAFVYFSNVRVVELSPYILVQPSLTNSLASSVIVTQGSSLTFTSSATFASAPITNTWYKGTGTPGGTGAGGVNAGVPTVALQTNSVNATNMSDTLTWTFNSPVDGTNYMSVFSDAAGSVTSRVVAVEVVFGPTNQTATAGSTFQFQVRAIGPVAPTLFQWKTNGVNLVNDSHYAGVTSSNLFITNVVASDAVTYSVLVSNFLYGTVTPSALLAVNVPVAPPIFSNVSVVGTNAILSFSSTNAFDSNSSFTLQSSPVVQGPYTNTPGSFTGSGGTFQVTVPQTGGNMFYRLLHN